MTECSTDSADSPNLAVQDAEAVLRQLAGAFAPPDSGGAVSPETAGSSAGVHNAPTGGPAGNRGKPAAPSWDVHTFEAVLESVPDGLLLVNDSATIVFVNRRMEDLFGYPRSELLGQPLEMLIPARFQTGHVALRNAYFADPRPRPMGVGLQLYGRYRDGREFPVEISLNPLPTAQGLMVTATIRDVTQRRLAEEHLRKAEARYRTLVEEIPAVTFIAGLEGDAGANELYVSPQIEELLGFSQREWLDDPVLWHTQLHPGDRERWHLEFARTCATGEPFRSVYRFMARDGRVVWVHGEAKVVRDKSGRPLFLQGVAFDITQRKDAEEALQQLNLTLERRVAEATVHAEARAQELARSNDDLDQFAYVASHDVREPLRTVASYIQRLARRYQGQLDETADGYIERAIQGTKLMDRLISDLHAYSQVGREGKLAPVDSAAIFTAVCGNLRAAIDDRNASVTAGPLPTVHAVETEFLRLLQNLIGNAVKFCSDRLVHVHVTAERQAANWLFAVRDNGIGIEPQFLERIFNISERLHSKTKYPGTGFGLAISRKIVERHGGKIWAESAAGQGSTFYFTWPAGGDV